MLIFDLFDDVRQAEAFARNCVVTYKLSANVFHTRKASDKSDPFPYELAFPVVHVARAGDADLEQRVINSVIDFGGRFAGT